jgi:hypothetical protein
MQVDNQFDGATKFPVVVSVTPSKQAALNIAIVKHLSSSQDHHFYENIRIDLGEAFVFLDDKLMVRVAEFLSKVFPEQPEADSEGESGETGPIYGDIGALPPAVNAWEILRDGVMPEIADLRLAVLTGKTMVLEACHKPGSGAASRAAARGADPVLYVRRFQVRPITLHLTLMSTGEGGGRGGRGGGAAVVRQYAGAMLERMIRQVRIDDVLVLVPGQVCVRTYIRVCVCVCVCVYVRTYAYVCIHTYIRMYVCIHTCVHTYVCTYVYIHMYTYIHTYTHIHTYMNT